MTHAVDHILLVGFGGPQNPDEIEPFLRRVAQGRNIPEARVAEVKHHYELVGGKSPYNDHAFALREALQTELSQNAHSLPVFAGMRNTHPFLEETIAEIKCRGLHRGIAILLAPYRSDTSCRRYKQNVEEAKQKAGAESISYEFIKPWHDHPAFIRAQADKMLKALNSSGRKNFKEISVVFTAHSIPLAMKALCEFCDYEKEYNASCALVAKALELARWQIAYQSRSGNLKDSWLEPDVLKVIREEAAQGAKTVLVVPIGFLFDNVEVLYDLDFEAKALAQQLGISFLRAETVMIHPDLVRFFTEAALENYKPQSQRTRLDKSLT